MFLFQKVPSNFEGTGGKSQGEAILLGSPIRREIPIGVKPRGNRAVYFPKTSSNELVNGE